MLEGDNIFNRTDDEIKKLFYKLHDRKSVADILEIKDKSLRYFLYSKEPDTLYKRFTLQKKNGGERIILAPMPKLKYIQKKMAYIFTLIYNTKSCVYGFAKNKNIVDNAKQHTKKNLILNIDLKDFFTQIHFGRVRGMLYNKPYDLSLEASTTIAQLVCYNGSLPQGAPSSPIITNMICKPLDNQLIKLSKKYGVTYSRYADDITFSTYKKEFPKEISKSEGNSLIIGQELLNIITKNSFAINNEKVFINSKMKRQEVTGLVVNKFPNIKREYIKELRAILYNCRKYGLYESATKYIRKGKCKNNDIILKSLDKKNKESIVEWFKEVLKGRINFIKLVRGNKDYIFLKYAKEFNTVFDEKIFDTSLLDTLYEKISNNVYIVESSEESLEHWSQGTCFILKGYGIITSYHVTEKAAFYKIYKDGEDGTFLKKNLIKDIHEKKVNKEIDYALYENMENSDSGFEIGDSTKLKIGESVTIIGYPDYTKNDTLYIHTCYITSKKDHYHGSSLYTVSGRIIHGASGGPVLNSEGEVVGLIKGGIVSLVEEQNNNNQGFVAIHEVINDIENIL